MLACLHVVSCVHDSMIPTVCIIASCQQCAWLDAVNVMHECEQCVQWITARRRRLLYLLQLIDELVCACVFGVVVVVVV